MHKQASCSISLANISVTRPLINVSERILNSVKFVKFLIPNPVILLFTTIFNFINPVNRSIPLFVIVSFNVISKHVKLVKYWILSSVIVVLFKFKSVNFGNILKQSPVSVLLAIRCKLVKFVRDETTSSVIVLFRWKLRFKKVKLVKHFIPSFVIRSLASKFRHLKLVSVFIPKSPPQKTGFASLSA